MISLFESGFDGQFPLFDSIYDFIALLLCSYCVPDPHPAIILLSRRFPFDRLWASMRYRAREERALKDETESSK